MAEEAEEAYAEQLREVRFINLHIYSIESIPPFVKIKLDTSLFCPNLSDALLPLSNLIASKVFCVSRCRASLTPRSPCLTSLRSSPHPSYLRASPAAASYRASPLSFRTSPPSTYLHIENGTSPTSSRLVVQSPNPSNPCSSILHLSGLLDPSLSEKMPVQEDDTTPRTPLPHHTCSLCSLIRHHDQRSLLSSGSLVSRNQFTLGRENLKFSAGPLCFDEEEGHCKCTEEDLSPPPSPTSPPTVKAKPVLAPYFPPSPVQEIGAGSSHSKDDNLQTGLSKISDPVQDQYLTIKRTLDTLLQKRRSPSAMVRASHASLSFPERLI